MKRDLPVVGILRMPRLVCRFRNGGRDFYGSSIALAVKDSYRTGFAIGIHYQDLLSPSLSSQLIAHYPFA